MVTAIVLIKAETNRIPDLANQIAETPGISEVFSVAGDSPVSLSCECGGVDFLPRENCGDHAVFHPDFVAMRLWCV